MLKRKNNRLFQSTFFTNTITLITGTTIAQALPLALTPIISRIYTPDDFGVLALFMSIVIILSGIVTLKYDLSIILPEKDEDAVNLMALSMIITLVISVVILFIILLFHDKLIQIIGGNSKEMSFWLYFVPFSTLLIGLYNSINYWAVRKLQFTKIAKSKIVQTSSMTFTQILSGLLKFTPKGLLFGEILGRLLSTTFLSINSYKTDKKLLKSVTKENLKKQAKRYVDFPKFSLPASFANVLTNQTPVFIIGKFFGGFTLGNYALMQRILAAPIALIGKAILDVFKQKAGEDYNNHGNCKEIYVKTFRTLLFVSILPALILFFFAPVLFDFIFGPEWAMAGEFAQIMSILFIFRFTASPLGYVLYIAEKQKYEMYWQIILFIFTIISFAIGVYYNDIKLGLICFASTYSVMYSVYLFLSYKFAKGN